MYDNFNEIVKERQCIYDLKWLFHATAVGKNLGKFDSTNKQILNNDPLKPVKINCFSCQKLKLCWVSKEKLTI